MASKLNIYYDNGKYGFADEKGTIVIKAIYDSIDPHRHEGDNHFVVIGDSWGVVDAEGKTIVECEQPNSSKISRNGKYYEFKRDGKVGVLDVNGKILVPPTYKYLSGLRFDYVIFYDNEGHDEEQAYHIYDLCSKTETVINAEYCTIKRCSDDEDKYFLIIQRDGKSGVCEVNGKVIIPAEYNISVDSWDCSKYVIYYRSDDALCVIDYNNNILLKSSEFDNIECNGRLISLRTKNRSYKTYDAVNWKEISGYDTVTGFQQFPESEIYLCTSDGNMGLLDKDFNNIVPCEYSKIESFVHNGVRFLKLVNKDDKIGLSDLNGNAILKCLYDRIINYYPRGYRETVFDSIVDKNDIRKYVLLFVSSDGVNQCINLEGDVVLPTWCENEIFWREGAAGIGKNDGQVYPFPEYIQKLWTKSSIVGQQKLQLVNSNVYDADGNMVFNGERSSNVDIHDNRILVYSQNKAVIYNEKGEEIKSIECSNAVSVYAFSYGKDRLCGDLIRFVVDGKSGFMTWDGTIISKPEFENDFQSRIIIPNPEFEINEYVIVHKSGLFGITTMSMEEILPAEYDDIYTYRVNSLSFSDNPEFHQYHINGELTMIRKGKKYGFLNQKLEIVLPEVYNEWLEEPSSNLYVEHYGLIPVKHGGNNVFVDLNGYEIIRGPLLKEVFYYLQPDNDGVKDILYYFGDWTLAAKCVDGKKFCKGLLDKDRNVVLDFKYDAIGDMSIVNDNRLFALVKQGSKYGIIDSSLNIVVPCEYGKNSSLEALPPSFAKALSDVLAGVVKL